MKKKHGKVFGEDEWSTLSSILKLAPREVEIVQLLCRGHKIGTAAEHLGISPNTAKTYLKRLYRKLGVQDRFELLCLMVETLRDGSRPRG